MSWVKHSRPAIIAAGIGLLVTFAASYAVGRWENRVASAEFVSAAKNQATLLQNGINEYRQRLMALRAPFESFNEGITRSEFEFFSDRLFAEHPGILRINWIPRVKRRQRIEFENSARSDGIVGYHFQSVAPNGALVPAPEGDEYFPVFYSTEPKTSISYGIDLASDAARRPILEGARDNDVMAVLPNTELRGSSGELKNAVFVAMPVYVKGTSRDTVSDRRRNLAGFIVARFEFSHLVETVLATTAASLGVPLDIEVPNPRLKTASVHRFAPGLPATLLGNKSINASSTEQLWSGTLQMGDATWTLSANPLAAGPLSPRHDRALIVLIAGIIITAILVAYVLLTSYHSRQLALAILRQQEAEQAIREGHANLRDVIEVMPAGLVIYDDQDKLVMWNRRYDETYPETRDLRVPGARFEDILRAGTERGMYAAASGREEEWIAERLALHTDPRETHEQRLSNGRWVRVEDHKTRLGGFIGIRVDITELKEREEDLRLQNMKLDTALQNMSQGLVMFDEEGRLVFCNRQYAELYGLQPDLMKPGTTQKEILDYRIARGIIPKANVEQYMSDRASKAVAGIESDSTLDLSDGRTLSVVIRPMPNGGWVTTHEDITDRRRAEEKIARLAHYDALTNLPNRVRFSEELDRALAQVRKGGRLGLLFLDLDHFKRANDTLGHLFGDELLKRVADRLRRCIGEADLVARLGGDEFAVIQALGEQTPSPDALASRISDALKAPFDLHGHKVVIGVSIGISIAPDNAIEPGQLLKYADLALYEAKDAGRNTYCFYEPELEARMRAQQILEVELGAALTHGEFEVHYQPIVNLESNEVTGFEALLRWRHPERGLLEPNEFISTAEEIGLASPLGEWVLRQACAEAANWPDNVKIAVNLSPAQLTGGKLLQAVVNVLAASGIPARRLELEITETTLMQNTFATLATLHQLRDLGVRVSMDDFGIGYSSLSHLRSFPFDGIKIDRSFISDLSDNDSSLAIVEALASMAQQLKITVTAEGVETEEQREKVRDLGCIEMQGYLFSSPRPAEEALQFFPPRAHGPAQRLSKAVADGRS
jgi:diguanylate cyclase (GGDEF)-like protein/PAS domain S-box-containing protein